MFGAATKKLAGEFTPGVEGRVLNVQSQLDSSDCQLLHLVVKKKKKWFWQSDKYETQPFSLADVLTSSSGGGAKELSDLGVEKQDLGEYNRLHVFKADGKVGANILAHTLEVKVSGEDHVVVVCKFGRLERRETDIAALVNTLAHLKVNFEHELVKQVLRQRSRKVLCLVTQAVTTVDGGKLGNAVVYGGKESIDFSPPTTAVSSILKSVVQNASEAASKDDKDKDKKETHHGAIYEELSVENSSLNTADIPIGTPLVYEARELMIDSAGGVEIALTSDVEGRLPRSVDEPDAAASAADRAELSSLLTSESRDAIRAAVTSLLPYHTALDTLADMLDDAELTGDEMTKSVLESRAGQTATPLALNLLKLLGFQDKGSELGGKGDTALVVAVTCLTAALAELSPHTLAAIAELQSDTGSRLAGVVAGVEEEGEVPEEGVKDVLSWEPARDVLMQLGILKTEGGKTRLTVERVKRSELSALVLALCGLFSD